MARHQLQPPLKDRMMGRHLQPRLKDRMMGRHLQPRLKDHMTALLQRPHRLMVAIPMEPPLASR